MDIIPLGHASFKIKGKHASVVTDPYSGSEVGLKFPKHTDATIVTVSHNHFDHNAIDAVEGSPHIINGPGEYDVAGVSVIGISVFHDQTQGKDRGKNTIYHIEMDGLHLVHLGDLGHVLSAAQIEMLDGVDVLFIPVGGSVTITPAQAAEVIAEIEPSIVIPMHYARPGLNPKVFGELSPVSAFLKEMGKEEIAVQPKLTITKEKLPTEMQIVVLE